MKATVDMVIDVGMVYRKEMDIEFPFCSSDGASTVSVLGEELEVVSSQWSPSRGLSVVVDGPARFDIEAHEVSGWVKL